MAKKRPPAEPPEDGHPSQETAQRHTRDIILRAAGFRIVARPELGQAKWMRDGIVYLERDAWDLTNPRGK